MGLGPAGGEHHLSTGREPFKADIVVDMQHALEPCQMRGGPLGLAVRRVDLNRRWRVGPAPGALVAGIDPQPPGFGASAPRIKHRNRRGQPASDGPLWGKGLGDGMAHAAGIFRSGDPQHAQLRRNPASARAVAMAYRKTAPTVERSRLADS